MIKFSVINHVVQPNFSPNIVYIYHSDVVLVF